MSTRAAATTRHTWTRTFRFPQFPWRPGTARRRSRARAPSHTLRLALAARRPEWQGTALPLSRPIGAALPLALPNSAIGSGTCASARPGMHWHFQTRQGSGAGALHRDRPPADRLRRHPSPQSKCADSQVSRAGMQDRLPTHACQCQWHGRRSTPRCARTACARAHRPAPALATHVRTVLAPRLLRTRAATWQRQP